MDTRERSGHRHADDLFRHGDAGEGVGALDALVRGVSRERGPATARGRGEVLFDVRHPVALTLSCLVYGGMFVLGLALVIGFAAGAAGHYSEADVLAHAPACAQGVDLATSDADCVGSLALAYDFGVYEEQPSVDGIDLYPAGTDDADQFVTAEFPASRKFDEAAGFDGTLRATYWEGRIVLLTAGSGADAVTVITLENPDERAGTDLAGALFSSTLLSLALFLSGLSRPVRRRLPPGRFVPLTLTTLALLTTGCFGTAIGLALQPERVLLAGILGPGIAGVLLALAWLLISRQSRWRTARVTP
jgi:hypothetical protein